MYARTQKAEALGYQLEDEYFYQSGLIEALIAVMATGDYELAGQILDPLTLVVEEENFGK